VSLIIEALKKARDDAVRRQAAARGLPLAPVPRLEHKSRWMTLALIPLVAALVVCVMLLIDVYSRLPENPAQPGVTRSTGAESIEDAEIGSRASTASSTGDSTSESKPTTSTSAVSPLEPGASSRSPGPAAPPTTSSSSDNDSLPAPGLSEAERSAGLEGPSVSSANVIQDARVSSSGQAQLRSGQIVDLGGIAWSESDPYALINGQVVGIGELVRSYRVTAITPDEVILEKDGDRVVLRLD
jgi:hypothetical protein